jgi:eukaryotic-like serine/threonine-protein kinase
VNAPAPIGVVAHYNLLERLEPAGPGDLYRARDTKLGRTVALRLLPADFTTGADSRAALVAQARAMTVLSHPNVTTLFEAGEHDGRVYLAFEFLQGQSLRAEMAGRPLKVHRAVETAIQITDALADAHANGFVHGGLSPESVAMTQKGHAKIPAFELAAHGGFDSRGGPGEVRLLDYLSPEEAAGQPPDDRSDIYSVGAILYEMLTAKRPNPKGAAAPSATNRHVLRELDDVVLRAVAPNPASRPESAAAFASELRGIAALLDAQGGASDEKDETQGPATTSGRVLLFGAIILAIAAFVWWIWQTRGA